MINFKLGFVIEGIYYGWDNGILYQLPYTLRGRYIAIRKIDLKETKGGWSFYRIRRKKVGTPKIKAMLKKVNWDVEPLKDLN